MKKINWKRLKSLMIDNVPPETIIHAWLEYGSEDEETEDKVEQEK